MKVMEGKFLKSCMKRNIKLGAKEVPSSACSKCCQWFLWPLVQQDKRTIPRDVPKGHLVVYVGEYRKRYVIKITLLKHPLFRALLDHAQEVYDFSADSKLCIPCDESVFLNVVRCTTSPEHRQICLCL
ncbi:OLC1v1034539C1 [Oldenlandia corymbosa var. corymbosa]|uniref:OLC1v1034539C1 n=1 Tax=Oldenlandia corymbosa var. corymbosa TaxID=529605 RepID=A0AAV1CQS2_OLDCO|nr:OLC1v1034539C1 [Oldenlandia corymbosa var. corymbosa]